VLKVQGKQGSRNQKQIQKNKEKGKENDKPETDDM